MCAVNEINHIPHIYSIKDVPIHNMLYLLQNFNNPDLGPAQTANFGCAVQDLIRRDHNLKKTTSANKHTHFSSSTYKYPQSSLAGMLCCKTAFLIYG